MKNNAQQICELCNLKWDEKISMDQIPTIEEALKTNIFQIVQIYQCLAKICIYIIHLCI